MKKHYMLYGPCVTFIIRSMIGYPSLLRYDSPSLKHLIRDYSSNAIDVICTMRSGEEGDRNLGGKFAGAGATRIKSMKPP